VSVLNSPLNKVRFRTDDVRSYPGIASQASFFLNGTEDVFGSLFQIGWAYAIGIAFAIIICGPTSGGHFNPAVTLCLAIWQGVRKIRLTLLALGWRLFVAMIKRC
jgi:glycerol uptake facilitator-like aquaporin